MAKRNGYTEKYTEEWIQAYKDGESIRGIAKRYGVSKTLVNLALSGIVKKRPKSPCLEYLDEWLELYLSGCSKTDIAKMYNVSKSAVGKILEKGGIERNGNKKFLHLLPKMEELYNCNLSFEQVGKELGISKQTISNYFKANDIYIRSYEESGQTYNIDFSHMKNLTGNGAYDLGLLFGLSHLVSKNGVFHRVRISSFYEELVEYLLKSINYDMPKEKYTYTDNTISIGISNLSFRKFLASNGLNKFNEKEIPNLKGKCKEDFLKGFLTAKLYGKTIGRCTAFRIETEKITNEIVEFLNRSLGIEASCVLKDGLSYLVINKKSQNQLLIDKLEEINELPFPLKINNNI